mgnify:CR=1 FL=1
MVRNRRSIVVAGDFCRGVEVLLTLEEVLFVVSLFVVIADLARVIIADILNAICRHVCMKRRTAGDDFALRGVAIAWRAPVNCV